MLTPKKIKYFQKIYKEEFGEEISDQVAFDMAKNLVDLYKLIFKPRPQNHEQKTK